MAADQQYVPAQLQMAISNAAGSGNTGNAGNGGNVGSGGNAGNAGNAGAAGGYSSPTFNNQGVNYSQIDTLHNIETAIRNSDPDTAQKIIDDNWDYMTDEQKARLLQYNQSLPYRFVTRDQQR